MGGLEHAKAELFDMSTLKWKKSTQYFKYNELYSFAAFFYNDMFYIVGGKTNKEVLSVVATLSPKTEKWSQVGKLKFSRFDHKIELIDDKIFVVGGSEFPEYCDLTNFACSMFNDATFKHENNPTLYAFFQSSCQQGILQKVVCTT